MASRLNTEMVRTLSDANVRGKRSYEQSRRRSGMIFLAPSLIVLAFVLVYPILQSILLSFKDVKVAEGLFGGEWAGFSNYLRMFEDPIVKVGVFNTVYFTVIEVIAVVAISLAFALLISERKRGTGWLMVLLLVPWAIAPVANATIWKWIYHGNFGILNTALTQTGVLEKNVIWLGEPFLALNMMLIADIWKAVPFITLLLIAGLKGVSPIQFKAAAIDGAGRWQVFWSIVLPQLKHTLMIVVVLQTIWAMKVFDLIFILTKGGPADGTVTMNFYAYRTTFNFGEMGYGAAIANVLFLVMFLVALGYIRLMGREPKRRGAHK